MSDYQRVVEFLRDFRTAPIQQVNEEVRAAATDYAELCTSANDRLRQCAVLLQRGLRAEAINLAEASPNLLDLVAALDLPAADRWAEFCQREDLPIPPPLQIERASQLNDAYGQEQPLEALYASHRRMALAQSPIHKRLAVMRQIAQMDASPFWDRDIRTFEYARFKELRLNFASAIQKKDVKTITSLSQEVLESPWLETVPNDLQSAAQDVNSRVRQVEFDAAMQDVVAKLKVAHTAQSLEQCTALLGKVDELMATYGINTVTGELAGPVESARTWAKQETAARAAQGAFIASCDALTAGLDADATPPELESLLRGAGSHGWPIPDELQQRYDATLRRRAQASTRKLLLGLASVAALLIIGLVVAFMVVRTKEEKKWALKIHEAVAKRDITLAKETIDDQEKTLPRLNEASDVRAAKREFDALKEQYDGDNAKLHEAISGLAEAKRKAEAAREAEEAAAGNPTATSTLDGLHDAASGLEQAVARARQLPDMSWADPHRSLPAAIKDLESLKSDLDGRFDQGVLSRMRAVMSKADQLDSGGASAASDAIVAEVDTNLSGLRGYLKTGSEASTDADAVAKKLAVYREYVDKHHDYAAARKALASSIGDSASARDALSDFARRYPDQPLSKDLLRAVGPLELYKSVEVWHQMCGPWAAEPTPSGEKAAQQRLDQIHGFLQSYPAAPEAPRASAYGDFLQDAADAMAVQNVWQTSINDVLTSPLIADLKYVQTSTGVRYYVLGDLNLRKRQANDRIIYTIDTLDPQNLTKKRQVSLYASVQLTNDTPIPMPHALFAQTLAEQLKTVDRSNWDSFGINLSWQIAQNQTIDPVVKAILLRDIIAATNKSLSWTGSELYERPVQDLIRQKLDTVIWYDNDHPVSPALLANLGKIFAEVPKPADARKVVEARKADLFKSFRPRFNGSGLLLRNDAGHWGIESASPVAAGSIAMAIVPPPGWTPAAASAPPAAAPPDAAPSSQPVNGPGDLFSGAPATAPATVPAEFVRIADCKDKGWVVDETAIHDLPQGTLVFVSKP